MSAKLEEAKFIEQYERVERWYQRAFRKNTRGEINLGNENYSDIQVDYIYAFFVNCYHLKDWIENDNTVEISKSQIMSYVAKNKYLSLCADICNSVKHLKLGNSGWSKQHPKLGSPIVITKTRVSIDTKAKTSEAPKVFTETFVSGYIVETDDGPIDAHDLAIGCINAWEDFLAQVLRGVME